jgi:hypothetical protein
MSDLILATPLIDTTIITAVEQSTVITAFPDEPTPDTPIIGVLEQGHTVITTFPGGPVIVGAAAIPEGQIVAAGSALSGHRAIALVAGVAVYADFADIDHAYLTIGVSKNAVLAGEPLRVFNRQSIEESTWAWSPGQPVFLGQGGLLSQAVPVSPAKFILQVGIAISTHRLDVDITRPIFI